MSADHHIVGGFCQLVTEKSRSMIKLGVLLVLCTILLGIPAEVVGDSGSDYLDQKELQVEMVVNQSIIDNGQECELLATCVNAANCSHYSCYPLIGDVSNQQCVPVISNKYCSLYGTTNTTCPNMNFDYTRSYVRFSKDIVIVRLTVTPLIKNCKPKIRCVPPFEDCGFLIRNLPSDEHQVLLSTRPSCTNFFISGEGVADPCKGLFLCLENASNSDINCFFRMAATTNVKSVDTMLIICSQRALEPLMISLSKPDVLSRVYFGAVDGTWRAFPGSAQSTDDCGKYDPRVRTWYKTATSVTKVVVILIDIGASMANNLSPSLGSGTILQAAKNIATEFLKTLSAQDYVNIIAFDSSRIIQLSDSAVLVQDDQNTGDAPELASLLSNLNNQTAAGAYRQSNLPGALNASLPNFDSNPDAAKVIIVITDGVFATFGNVTLPVANLSRLNVKVFLYKLPQPDDTDIFLSNNTLISQLCSVGGHFEPILQNLENPLLVLQKVSTYLANLKRIATDGKPQYSYVYQDYDQIGGNITTVTKTAFGTNGDLLGAAGISIYLGLLGNLTAQVEQALQSRITGNNPASPTIVLTAANCTITRETSEPCGGNITYPASYGLCPKTDYQSSIQDLECCGLCRGRSHMSSKTIVGITIGSVLGFVVVMGILICLYLRWQESKRKEKELHAEFAIAKARDW